VVEQPTRLHDEVFIARLQPADVHDPDDREPLP
jgi:hypothetical protein